MDYDGVPLSNAQAAYISSSHVFTPTSKSPDKPRPRPPGPKVTPHQKKIESVCTQTYPQPIVYLVDGFRKHLREEVAGAVVNIPELQDNIFNWVPCRVFPQDTETADELFRQFVIRVQAEAPACHIDAKDREVSWKNYLNGVAEAMVKVNPELLQLRNWSSKTVNTPIGLAESLRKPDLVLISKGHDEETIKWSSVYSVAEEKATPGEMFVKDGDYSLDSVSCQAPCSRQVV